MFKMWRKHENVAYIHMWWETEFMQQIADKIQNWWKSRVEIGLISFSGLLKWEAQLLTCICIIMPVILSCENINSPDILLMQERGKKEKKNARILLRLLRKIRNETFLNKTMFFMKKKAKYDISNC